MLNPEASVASSAKRRHFTDLHVSASDNDKPFNLRCRFGTGANDNVMPVNIYKNCFLTIACVDVDQSRPINLPL